MNILQVVDLQHKYLKGELTFSELPSSEQVEKAQKDFYRIVALKIDLITALKEIAKAEGAYSMDELTHARNTIENMVSLAENAIKIADPQNKHFVIKPKKDGE